MPESSPLTPRTATGTYRTEVYAVVGVDWAELGTADARNATSATLLRTSSATDLMGPPLPRGEPRWAYASQSQPRAPGRATATSRAWPGGDRYDPARSSHDRVDKVVMQVEAGDSELTRV